MIFILAAMVAAFLATLFVIRRGFAADGYSRVHLDARHNPWVRNVPHRGWGRMGGIGLVIGLVFSFGARYFDDAAIAGMGLLLVLSAIPVFVAGLLDDLTQDVRASVRLLAAFISPAIAGVFLNAWINRVDVPALDWLLLIPALTMLLSCVFVAGLTHAFNIIDGFNGLASGVAALILLGIVYVAFKVEDIFILASAMTAIGAVAGFMFLNFPRGLVFLGDGGAYLLGFWIGELLILLVARHPQVSAWFPVLLCSYPVCEVLFSIYRRLFVQRGHPGTPDVAHLHHLIYMRLVRWMIGPQVPKQRVLRNSLTTPYLWILTSVGVAPAVVLWQHTRLLQIGSVVFALGYVYAYMRIARFRSPRWAILRSKGK